MDGIIGSLVKSIRKSSGITLKELAGGCGLSVGYLSLLERGLNSPTITNLHKICQVLNITLADLFTHLNNDQNIVKKDGRRVIFETPGSLKYEAVTEGNRHINSTCMTIYDDVRHESDSHIADEFGYIVKGSMTIVIDGMSYELGEGDAVYIRAGSVHSCHKTSDCECVSIWACHNISLEDISNIHNIGNS